MTRRLEYPTPRAEVRLRLTLDDLLTLKVEAKHLHRSVNRLIEEAVRDWIVREAGQTRD